MGRIENRIQFATNDIPLHKSHLCNLCFLYLQSFDWGEVERTKEIIKHEWKYATESVARKTLFYQMNSKTNRIENVSMGEVKQALAAMNSEITFSNRTSFGTIEVKF